VTRRYFELIAHGYGVKNSVCEIARMGEIAAMLFDNPDEGLFVFATGHLDWMLQRFKDRYYAEEFPGEN